MEKAFIPQSYNMTLRLKTSSHRALQNCADHYHISKTKLAIRLLENAIFKEAQSHNPMKESKL